MSFSFSEKYLLVSTKIFFLNQRREFLLGYELPWKENIFISELKQQQQQKPKQTTHNLLEAHSLVSEVLIGFWF